MRLALNLAFYALRKAVAVAATDGSILLETSDFILLETGDQILLE